MEREADVGGILSQTVDVMGGAGRAVIIFVLVLGVFSGIGGLFGLASVDDNFITAQWTNGGFDTQSASMMEGVFGLANIVLFVIAAYLLLKEMLAAVGRPMRGGSRFWSFLGLSILATIATVLGFLLFIIPGIILLVRWSAANGFVMNGEHGIRGSLGASWEATEGRGLSIFGAGLLMWIVLVVLAVMVSGVIGGLGFATSSDEVLSPMLAVAVAASGFLEAFTNAASLAFSIAVFHLVAPGDTSVADVFE